jgi:hypothetical protein
MASEKNKEKEACKHRQVFKEYMLGCQTGDRICTECREVVYTQPQWDAYSSGKGPQLHDLP